MKSLLIAIVLIIVIVAFGMMISAEFRTYAKSAALILSGIHSNDIRAQVREHFNTHIQTNGKTLEDDALIQIETAYINTDNLEDVVATIESKEACGSGGCLTVLLVQAQRGKFEAIPFGYAVKDLVVESSITNQMHDITINNDSENKMVWDGERYTLNSF